MKTNHFFTIPVVLLGIILFSGCGFGNNNQKKSAANEQTIFSEDSLFSLTIPKAWTQVTDYSLNDEAELQAEKLLSSQYIVVLIENKNDLDYTFDEWTTTVSDTYFASFDDSSVLGRNDILIDNQPAKQFEVNLTHDHIKMTMLATYVNGENHYAQILAWTLASKYKSSLEELKAITNSIKGL